MRVYFVRHGQTDHNANQLHQPVTAELSATGTQQAEALARRFSAIAVDRIIASPYVRTKQTAEIINNVLKKDVSFDERIREVKKPSEVEDKAYDDPTASYIKKLCEANFANPTWRHSDEENFDDLAKRTKSFAQSLCDEPDSNILVVTHGTILKFLILEMILPQYVMPEVYLSLNTALYTMNTGITVCQRKEDKTWQLLTWNDHAHIG